MILHYNTTLTPSSKAIYSGTNTKTHSVQLHTVYSSTYVSYKSSTGTELQTEIQPGL